MLLNKEPALRWVKVVSPGLFFGQLVMKGTTDEIRAEILDHWKNKLHWDIPDDTPISIEELPHLPTPLQLT